jgi:hypothetical protein
MANLPGDFHHNSQFAGNADLQLLWNGRFFFWLLGFISDFFEFIFAALSIWPGFVRCTDNSAGFP